MNSRQTMRGMGFKVFGLDINFNPKYSPTWQYVRPVLDAVGTAAWYLPIGKAIEDTGETIQGVTEGDWAALIPSPIKDAQKMYAQYEYKKAQEAAYQQLLTMPPPQPQVIIQPAPPTAVTEEQKQTQRTMLWGGAALGIILIAKMGKIL